MRVQVLTDDRLGSAMAGSALRAWEVAKATAAVGHEVQVVAAAGSVAPDPSGPAVVGPDDRWRRADAVVSPPWCAPWWALHGRHLLILDGVTPLLAELATMADDDPEVRRRRRTAAVRLELASARADAVLVAGEAQRRWWTRQARLAPERVLELPFGVPDRDPPAGREIPGVPASHQVVLWWGGVWPWLDLETLLAARALLGGPAVSLVVPVATRPGGRRPALDATALLGRARAHGLTPPQVVGLDTWVPYDQRHRILNRAAVVAVLHHPGREADLSFRTRCLDGLWAGVPLLVTEGGAVSDLTRQRGWGAVVPPAAPRPTAAALELLLGGRSRERAVAALAADRDRWRWREVTAPFLELLPRLGPRPDRRRLRPATVGRTLLAGLGRWSEAR